MSKQPGDSALIRKPTEARSRDPLPRFKSEMVNNTSVRQKQMRNSSNSSDEDDLSSLSPSPSPSPQLRRKTKQTTRSSIRESAELIHQSEKRINTTFECGKLATNHYQKHNSQSTPVKESTSQISLFILALIIVGIFYTLIPNYSIVSPVTEEYHEALNKDDILKNVESELRRLKGDFRNQEKKIWEEIYSGIMEVISNPTKPSIFVLFSEKNDPMDCLASTIGELGRRALGSEKSLVLKPAQLDKDTGEVIETLRVVIPKRKAVIFWDLLSINDEALKAFHNLCDRENPLVKEAIYIITVKAQGYSRSQNPLQFIENQLRSNLSGRIDEDSIMPLITRITDGPIISVRPESNIQCRFKNTILFQ